MYVLRVIAHRNLVISSKLLASRILQRRNMAEIIQHTSSSTSAKAESAVVRVGVGCFVIDPVNHPSQFLVGTRRGSHGAGKLALPGGHLEMNESWESCAAREVFEETNLSVDKLHLFTVTNDAMIDGNPLKHYITLFMVSSITSESAPLQNMEPHKCDSWDWITWQDLIRVNDETPERLFEPMRNLITRAGRDIPKFLLIEGATTD